MRKARTAAVIVTSDPFLTSQRDLIVRLAGVSGIATFAGINYFVESGGLMSYGPSLFDVWRRAAGYVDKILKGAKPADLPVEQPTKFELVINLKTAKTLGVKISDNLLSLADEVFE